MSEKTSVSLTPHLVCRDAAQAIEFYKKAFAAQQVFVSQMPDGKVMHATLSVGGATVYLCDECPEFGNRSPLALGGTPIVLNLSVADADAWFERAVAAGCTVTMPLEDQFWGDRYGVVADPYGHKWSISTHVRDVPPEEFEKIVKEFATAGV
jgi:PhnB protein